VDAEQGVLVQVLRDLAAHEARWYSEADLDPDLRSIYSYLETRFRRYDESEIQAFVRAHPETGTLHEWGGYIFLKACRTGEWAVPVLNVEYNFASGKLGLRIGLFLNAADEPERIGSIGYRFETPDIGGENPFFHLQHIIELGNGSGELPTPSWMPQSKVAVPLDVKTNLGLMLCLLASLYGWGSDVVGHVMNAQYQQLLTTHVQSLAWTGADTG